MLIGSPPDNLGLTCSLLFFKCRVFVVRERERERGSGTGREKEREGGRERVRPLFDIIVCHPSHLLFLFLFLSSIPSGSITAPEETHRPLTDSIIAWQLEKFTLNSRCCENGE